MNLFQRIAGFAAIQPQALALQGSGLSIDYHTLAVTINELSVQLEALQVGVLALDLDNGPAWALLDLAATKAGICLVPIPPFFSSRQVEHCLSQAGVDLILTDCPERMLHRLADLQSDPAVSMELCGTEINALRTRYGARRIPQQAVKLTFTSGTTAEPKGVMLAWRQIEAVVTSLADAVEVVYQDRHLCLMPLSILLENVAGLYVPLWCGATAALPSLGETGLLGAAGLDAQRMMSSLQAYEATTAIFTPQMLQGAVEFLERDQGFYARLRFVAVGGATVSRRLLARAERVGLPVFEGYGLSEAASVTCLNRPGCMRPGSVGKPLPHLQLRIAEDGEVLIKNDHFLGYLGETQAAIPQGWWHTGDIGHLDDEGFLYLRGRRRHLFITAHGRNVSPEWVERELVLEPAIAQAALFGEARPWNLAVIVPAAGSSTTAIEQALQRVNRQLPDYARVAQWLSADAPFSVSNGQLSANGRLRRQAVHQHYQCRMAAFYQQEYVS
ncbi:MAG: AMP-binding protein [Candidatus Thiodiazotropha sp. (ex Epidulcina cf. delphinae)]|nr:AMP-binding protein [Candidatus Thiodiazotropha sp. (ex Epidulcina cf. delphinae)]